MSMSIAMCNMESYTNSDVTSTSGELNKCRCTQRNCVIDDQFFNEYSDTFEAYCVLAVRRLVMATGLLIA